MQIERNIYYKTPKIAILTLPPSLMLLWCRSKVTNFENSCHTRFSAYTSLYVYMVMHKSPLLNVRMNCLSFRRRWNDKWECVRGFLLTFFLSSLSDASRCQLQPEYARTFWYSYILLLQWHFVTRITWQSLSPSSPCVWKWVCLWVRVSMLESAKKNTDDLELDLFYYWDRLVIGKISGRISHIHFYPCWLWKVSRS